MFRRKPVEVLTDVEKTRRVSTALAEAEKCMATSDAACAVQRLREAKKYEECPPCKRTISRAISTLPFLPAEKQARKIQLTKEYVEGAAPLREKAREIQSLRPSRRQVFAGKTRSGLRSAGRTLRGVGGWVKRRFKKQKPQEVKTNG